MLAEGVPISRYRRRVSGLVALALIGIVLGLLAVPASLAFDPGLAGRGILGQLAVTGPAALAVAIVSLVNLAAGSVVVGVIVRRPMGSIADGILAAFVGAV